MTKNSFCLTLALVDIKKGQFCVHWIKTDFVLSPEELKYLSHLHKPLGQLIIFHNLAGIYYISAFYNVKFEVSNYLSSLARNYGCYRCFCQKFCNLCF